MQNQRHCAEAAVIKPEAAGTYNLDAISGVAVIVEARLGLDEPFEVTAICIAHGLIVAPNRQRAQPPFKRSGIFGDGRGLRAGLHGDRFHECNDVLDAVIEFGVEPTPTGIGRVVSSMAAPTTARRQRPTVRDREPETSSCAVTTCVRE